ncbi:MAG: ATP-binding cassette domain-containing protein [Acidobacteria bacterium]|nr:ATP-binding cassette domain-containing protein [Acidobacteriota bacterium]
MLHVSIKTRLGAGEKKSDKGANGQTERSFLLDVEFVVPDGVTILFGPSGAGKTTCLRAIAGIVTPDEGCIRLGERVFFDSVAGVNLPMQQRRVGYVFQDYLLFPHLTAEQNVAYGLRASKHTDKHARIRALLTQLGIEYAAQQYPHELSGGEAQRVAIARALASEPEVFLMDEPLSAVDAQTRERILAEIGSLQKQTGIPFLYVTHNTHEARAIGTHLITMANGQITQSDLTALS